MALSFIPLGTIKKEKEWPVPFKEINVICRYNFNYILAHDLGFASNIKWYSSANPSKEIHPIEVKEMFKNKLPHLSLWEQYSLFIVLTIFFIFTLLST